MILRVFSFCILLATLFAAAGCKTAPDAGRYAVTAMKAPFYKYGPAQAFGADFALVRGQHLTMVERGFGFSRVLTEDGVTGYISTDDIERSADPIPPKVQPRVASRRGPSSGTASIRRKPATLPEPDGGLFNVNDLPLPTEPELPKKDEAPASANSAAPKPDSAKPEATPTPKPNAKKRRS